MKILTAGMVEALLPMRRAIDLMRTAMAQVSDGKTLLPLRQFVVIPGGQGKLAVMPGHIADPACFGVKLVSKFPRALGDRHGSHVGGVMLFDADDGVPLALLDGASLTAIRTAAASAMATDLLAREDARTLLVLGAGEQARRHVEALRHVRRLERVRVWARDAERASALADEVEGEVAGVLDEDVASADIVCTTTASTTPVLRGTALSPGAHVNLVGAAVATSREADAEVVSRGRVFVDYRPAAEAAAGEIIDALAAGLVPPDHVAGEIGEVLLERVLGRRSAQEITVYKSLGVTAQDLIVAHAVWRAAEEAGIGLEVDLADATPPF